MTALSYFLLASSFEAAIDMLEDNDDVSHVYANCDISDEIMEALS